jgi:hypothetical protein
MRAGAADTASPTTGDGAASLLGVGVGVGVGTATATAGLATATYLDTHAMCLWCAGGT